MATGTATKLAREVKDELTHVVRTAGRAKREAKPAAKSTPARVVSRAGLVGRGIFYLIVGGIAVQIAVNDGSSSHQADASGALRTVAQQPLGHLMLVILGIGLAAYAVFRLIDGVYLADRESSEPTRWGERVVSFGALVVYAVFATLSLLVAFGASHGGSERKDQTLTAKVLGWPGGPELVAAVGLGLVIAGVVLAVHAIGRRFLEDFRKRDVGDAWALVTVLGIVGHLGRGIAYTLVGVFVFSSAVTFDPNRARGLDQSLRTLAEQPYGPYALGVVAAGLIGFGFYCFAESRWRWL